MAIGLGSPHSSSGPLLYHKGESVLTDPHHATPRPEQTESGDPHKTGFEPMPKWEPMEFAGGPLDGVSYLAPRNSERYSALRKSAPHDRLLYTRRGASKYFDFVQGKRAKKTNWFESFLAAIFVGQK